MNRPLTKTNLNLHGKNSFASNTIAVPFHTLEGKKKTFLPPQACRLPPVTTFTLPSPIFLQSTYASLPRMFSKSQTSSRLHLLNQIMKVRKPDHRQLRSQFLMVKVESFSSSGGEGERLLAQIPRIRSMTI